MTESQEQKMHADQPSRPAADTKTKAKNQKEMGRAWGSSVIGQQWVQEVFKFLCLFQNCRISF